MARDFWGREITKRTEEPEAAQPERIKRDYWGNPIRRSPEAEARVEEARKRRERLGDEHSLEPTKDFELNADARQDLSGAFGAAWGAAVSRRAEAVAKAQEVEAARADVAAQVAKTKARKKAAVMRGSLGLDAPSDPLERVRAARTQGIFKGVLRRS